MPTHLDAGNTKITGGRTKIADLLAMPGIDDVELEIPQLRDLAQPTDLS